MQMSASKALLLLITLALVGCGQSEDDCQKRLIKMTDEDISLTVPEKLLIDVDIMKITRNPDLNVCDYTVFGNDIIKK